MTMQRKPSLAQLIERISVLASLPTSRGVTPHRFTREQLVELAAYLDNVNRQNQSLRLRVKEVLGGDSEI